MIEITFLLPLIPVCLLDPHTPTTTGETSSTIALLTRPPVASWLHADVFAIIPSISPTATITSVPAADSVATVILTVHNPNARLSAVNHDQSLNIQSSNISEQHQPSMKAVALQCPMPIEYAAIPDLLNIFSQVEQASLSNTRGALGKLEKFSHKASLSLPCSCGNWRGHSPLAVSNHLLRGCCAAL